MSRPRGRKQWDRIKLGIPLVGPLYIKMICARFSQTLGTMLESGLIMMKALDVVKTVVQNRVVEEALELDSHSSNALWGLGRVSFEQGRYADAANKMDMALKMRPKKTAWRIQLGKVYRSMGKKDEAAAQWKQVLEVDPDNEQAKKLLGE